MTPDELLTLARAELLEARRVRELIALGPAPADQHAATRRVIEDAAAELRFRLWDSVVAALELRATA